METYEGKQFGNYRLTRFLGTGAFADVYLGEHVHLQTHAAIKVLQTRLIDEEILARFQHEAHVIASLVHPNIVRVWDYDVSNAMPFLVMDYAAHGSLRERHPKGSRLSPHEILPYVQQIAAALQHAHDLRLVHRDVKPENILLSTPKNVLLSDFGLVVIAQTTALATTREMAGTVAYMAPEQIKGRPRPASDQYALAVVMYEWLSGTLPFAGSFMEVANQHLLAPVPSLRERVPILSPALDAVLQKALSKDPHARFPNVKTFAATFAEACTRTARSISIPAIRKATQPVSSSTTPAQAMPPLVASSTEAVQLATIRPLPITDPTIGTVPQQQMVLLPGTNEVATTHRQPGHMSFSQRFTIITLVSIIALLLVSGTVALANAASPTPPSTIQTTVTIGTTQVPTATPTQQSTPTQQPAPAQKTAPTQQPAASANPAPVILPSPTPAQPLSRPVTVTPSLSPSPSPTYTPITPTPSAVATTPTPTSTQPAPTSTPAASTPTPVSTTSP